MIDVEIPSEFMCPLTLDVMKEPVMTKYGHSYDRDALLRWLKAGHGTCPLSRRPLNLTDIVSNHALSFRITHWQLQNGHGDSSLLRSRSRENMVYGYITIPEKGLDDPEDDTEQTLDEMMEEVQEDIAVISAAVARELERQDARRAQRRRQQRRRSSDQQQRGNRQQQQHRRPLRALRNIFSTRQSASA